MSKPWKRLGPWLPGGEPPGDGDAALRALSDITQVRRDLEQAELAAVRTARRHARSWTEIATMLAVTRQSAWERWRDLDDVAAAATDDAGRAAGPADRARRRRLVTVPDVVGFTATDALGMLTHAGLDAASATPGIGLLDGPGDEPVAVVVRQYPDSGTRVRGASTVRLWLERGDGEAGVREPRRPSPPPLAARVERDELTGEAVG